MNPTHLIINTEKKFKKNYLEDHRSQKSHIFHLFATCRRAQTPRNRSRWLADLWFPLEVSFLSFLSC